MQKGILRGYEIKYNKVYTWDYGDFSLRFYVCGHTSMYNIKFCVSDTVLWFLRTLFSHLKLLILLIMKIEIELNLDKVPLKIIFVRFDLIFVLLMVGIHAYMKEAFGQCIMKFYEL